MCCVIGLRTSMIFVSQLPLCSFTSYVLPRPVQLQIQMCRCAHQSTESTFVFVTAITIGHTSVYLMGDHHPRAATEKFGLASKFEIETQIQPSAGLVWKIWFWLWGFGFFPDLRGKHLYPYWHSQVQLSQGCQFPCANESLPETWLGKPEVDLADQQVKVHGCPPQWMYTVTCANAHTYGRDTHIGVNGMHENTLLLLLEGKTVHLASAIQGKHSVVSPAPSAMCEFWTLMEWNTKPGVIGCASCGIRNVHGCALKGECGWWDSNGKEVNVLELAFGMHKWGLWEGICSYTDAY